MPHLPHLPQNFVDLKLRGKNWREIGHSSGPEALRKSQSKASAAAVMSTDRASRRQVLAQEKPGPPPSSVLIS